MVLRSGQGKGISGIGYRIGGVGVGVGAVQGFEQVGHATLNRLLAHRVTGLLGLQEPGQYMGCDVQRGGVVLPEAPAAVLVLEVVEPFEPCCHKVVEVLFQLWGQLD